jgi:iron complex outermembrane receptor protein
VAVTAMTARALEDAAVSGVRQLTVAVPGYNGGRNFVGLQPVLRGVGSSGVSMGDEPNVALYIDGVYQPSSHSNTIDLVEVERVEVLRGPQGTIFGRNATGGLINVITPDPSFQPHGDATVNYGRMRGANDVTAKGYLTGPLGGGGFAADIAALYRKNGGYIDNLVTGGKLGGSEAVNLRGKLMFEPTDNGKVVLSVARNHNKDNGANSPEPFMGNTIGNTIPGIIKATGYYQAALSLQPMIDVKTTNVALRTHFDLGPVVLETTSGWFQDHVIQQSDNDASPVVAAQNRTEFRNDVVSQEVRLLSDASGPFKWIAGVYAFHLRGTANILSFSGVSPTFTTVNQTRINPLAHTEAYAAFAEGTYNVTDALRITLGGRYSDETRDFSTNINGNQLITKAKTSFSKWTYRGTAQYVFNSRANVYVSYSTGFKSGVYNTFGTSTTPVRPETVKAIEGGVKADPLPWLRTNLALFHYDYQDLQVTGRVPNSPLYLLLNAAKAKIKGAELEVEAAVNPDFNIRFAGSLLDAKYDSFPNAQVFVPTGRGGNATATQDVSGNRLLRAPKYTLSLGADWSTDVAGGRMKLSGNLFNSARVYYDFANRVSQKPYTLANAEVSWSPQAADWRVGVYATNLTNTHVVQQISTTSFADFFTLERPREVGISAQYKF